MLVGILHFDRMSERRYMYPPYWEMKPTSYLKGIPHRRRTCGMLSVLRGGGIFSTWSRYPGTMRSLQNAMSTNWRKVTRMRWTLGSEASEQYDLVPPWYRRVSPAPFIVPVAHLQAAKHSALTLIYGFPHLLGWSATLGRYQTSQSLWRASTVIVMASGTL